jgi:hypothetical protein
MFYHYAQEAVPPTLLQMTVIETFGEIRKRVLSNWIPGSKMNMEVGAFIWFGTHKGSHHE